MERPPRPRFSPSSCDSQPCAIPPLTFASEDGEWLPIVSCPAGFPSNLFERAVEQLIHHPEYNSTLILRSETISETSYSHGDTHHTHADGLESHRFIYSIHRRLLPRRPGRDAAIEQRCTLYASTAGIPCTLVLSPLLPPGASLPYYHPPVRHLAFRFVPSEPPILRIEAVVLPNTPLDLNSRLYRTALALLEALHRYGWGALTHYQKRVNHDCVIQREEYQDLYLVMRERYKHMVSDWKESTDPLKHVFEDIGIATYLILLWKRSFTTIEQPSRDCTPGPDAHRPRPPGGFLDLGCGNGLLTHILVSEGYHGHGIDLRARTSWSHYPERTRAALHVHALDPRQYIQPATEGRLHVTPFLQSGAFLIGNHADELTPWLSLMATLEHASGYLSIPCCAWSFDERFSRASMTVFADFTTVVDDKVFLDRLNLGGDGGCQSRYAMYRIWLAKVSEWMGWKVECDTLRIPSTRNWAIMGRERLGEDDQMYEERALDIVHGVVKRGAFKTRIPEGKAGDH